MNGNFKGVIIPFSRRDQLEYAIKEVQPEYAAIISSQELLEEAAYIIKMLKEKLKFNVHYYIHNNLKDPGEAMDRFNEALEWLRSKKLKHNSIAIDITGGLVPTRFGVNMGAIFNNVHTFYQYMEHRGTNGGFEFIEGTKKMIRLDNPLEKSGLLRGTYAAMMFNKRNYQAAGVLFADILIKVEGHDLIYLYEGLKKVSDAYREWDRAVYKQAYQLLTAAVKTLSNRFFNDRMKKQLARTIAGLNENIDFLRTINDKKLAISNIVDMYSNAGRRIEDEGRFDDGVGRLYRTIEMIVHYLLIKYSVDYVNVQWDTIRKEIRERFLKEKKINSESLPNKLGLWDGLILLEGYDEKLCRTVFSNRETMLKLLRSRNQSILAHGIKPVSESTAKEFLSHVRSVLLNLLSVESYDTNSLQKSSHVTLELEMFS